MGEGSRFGTKELAAIAVMGALTTVCTMMIQVPFPATGGYFNLGDAIVVTTALVFGPVIGAIAGGLGSGLADLLGGWMAFVIPTTLIKGAEGYVVGYLAGDPAGRTLTKSLIAWLAGGVVIVVGYFVAEAFFLGMGVEAAAAEIIINVPQAIGSVVGVVISIAVKDRLKL
ncbi:MAG: ECF transporter S component [Candidatus Bathyarchaeota archaeon]|nr:MAG: ECF transporter S component [Candidatus Bathyarchaeota archaeon]